MSESGTQFMKCGDIFLPYREYGTGRDLLIAFHGFGRTGADFIPMQEYLGKQYTIIAVDFFFHGMNAWKWGDGIPAFTPHTLAGMIENLLMERNKTGCSLLGYSQGGRLVMGLVHLIPHLIHDLFVLAPDGMKSNTVRSVIANTLIGRKLGSVLVRKPGLLILIIKLINRLGFINARVKQFYLLNTKTEADRLKLYHLWLLLRNYPVNKKRMRHSFSLIPMRVEFFFGKYDTIIPLKRGKKFTAELSPGLVVHVFECGHDILQMTPEICAAITKPGT